MGEGGHWRGVHATDWSGRRLIGLGLYSLVLRPGDRPCRQQNTRPGEAASDGEAQSCVEPPERPRPAAAGRQCRGAGGQRGHRAASSPEHSGGRGRTGSRQPLARRSRGTSQLQPRRLQPKPAPASRVPLPAPPRRASAHCRLGSHFAGPQREGGGGGCNCAGARRERARLREKPEAAGRTAPASGPGGGGAAVS